MYTNFPQFTSDLVKLNRYLRKTEKMYRRVYSPENLAYFIKHRKFYKLHINKATYFSQ